MKKYSYMIFYLQTSRDTWHTNHTNRDKQEELNKILNGFAQNGYRYVGYIPIEYNSAGAAICINLIFEKDT